MDHENQHSLIPKPKQKDSGAPEHLSSEKVEKSLKLDLPTPPLHSLAFWKSQKAQTLKEHAKQFGLNEQGSNEELCVQLATFCADRLGTEPDTTTKSWCINIPTSDEDGKPGGEKLAPSLKTRSRSRSKPKQPATEKPCADEGEKADKDDLYPVLQALKLPQDVTKSFHAALCKARVSNAEQWAMWQKSLKTCFKSSAEKLAHLSEYGLSGLPALQVLNFFELEGKDPTAKPAPKRSRQSDQAEQDGSGKPRKAPRPAITKEVRQQVSLKGKGSEGAIRRVDFGSREEGSLGIVTL